MAGSTGAQPGSWIGRPGLPVRYQLRKLVADSGLEGEVWLAESADGGVTQRWAVKILSAERFGPARNPGRLLREWEQRWLDTTQRTHSLEPFAGIVLPADVFRGSPPRRSPRSDAPPGRLLYMVSRWVDGGLNLWEWRYAESDEAAWCDVLEEICRLVARLGAEGMVHGDLSPTNVMLENGDVRLIDFTFMAPAGAPPFTREGTSGYAAPEMQARDVPVDPAIDRYAVGALAYFLLMGDDRRDELWHVRQSLRREYTDSLADRVVALLDPDPRKRPADLTAWVADVRRLVGHGIRADHGHAEVAIAADGRQTTEIVAVGSRHITVAAASSRRHPMLQTLSEPAPGGVRAVALARRGNGDLVMFTRDAAGELAVRVDGVWRRPDRDLRLAGPIRAAGHGDGRASGFARTADDHLVQVSVGLDGKVELARLAPKARRVLAAASGLDGRVFLAVEDPLGMVHCGPPDGMSRTTLSDVSAAALCVNSADLPVCVRARPGSAELNVITQPDDDDLAYHETVPAKPGIHDVACLWLRTGLVLAIATDSGLWVKPEPDDWKSLWPHPVTRVALGVGYGWRAQVAALTDGRVIYAEERGVNRWAEANLLEPAPA